MNNNDFIHINSKVISFHIVTVNTIMINSSTNHSFLLNMVGWLTLQTESDNIGFYI